MSTLKKTELYPGKAFTLEHLLTDIECAQLMELSDSLGWEKATLDSGGHADADASPSPSTSRAASSASNDEMRNHSRSICDDGRSGKWAAELWERACSHVGPDPEDGFVPCRLDSKFRFYRYDEGEKFSRHFDGYSYGSVNYATDLKGPQARWSFLVYLNEDFQGGQTRFFQLDGKLEFQVHPKRGMALLYDHSLLHDEPLDLQVRLRSLDDGAANPPPVEVADDCAAVVELRVSGIRGACAAAATELAGSADSVYLVVARHFLARQMWVSQTLVCKEEGVLQPDQMLTVDGGAASMTLYVWRASLVRQPAPKPGDPAPPSLPPSYLYGSKQSVLVSKNGPPVPWWSEYVWGPSGSTRQRRVLTGPAYRPDRCLANRGIAENWDDYRAEFHGPIDESAPGNATQSPDYLSLDQLTHRVYNWTLHGVRVIIAVRSQISLEPAGREQAFALDEFAMFDCMWRKFRRFPLNEYRVVVEPSGGSLPAENELGLRYLPADVHHQQSELGEKESHEIGHAWIGGQLKVARRPVDADAGQAPERWLIEGFTHVYGELCARWHGPAMFQEDVRKYADVVRSGKDLPLTKMSAYFRTPLANSYYQKGGLFALRLHTLLAQSASLSRSQALDANVACANDGVHRPCTLNGFVRHLMELFAVQVGARLPPVTDPSQDQDSAEASELTSERLLREFVLFSGVGTDSPPWLAELRRAVFGPDDGGGDPRTDFLLDTAFVDQDLDLETLFGPRETRYWQPQLHDETDGYTGYSSPSDGRHHPPPPQDDGGGGTDGSDGNRPMVSHEVVTKTVTPSHGKSVFSTFSLVSGCLILSTACLCIYMKRKRSRKSVHIA